MAKNFWIMVISFAVGCALSFVGMRIYSIRAVDAAKLADSKLAEQQQQLYIQLEAINTRLTASLITAHIDLKSTAGKLEQAVSERTQSELALQSANAGLERYRNRDKQLAQLVGEVVADARASSKLSDSGYAIDLAINSGISKFAIIAGASDRDIRQATIGEGQDNSKPK